MIEPKVSKLQCSRSTHPNLAFGFACAAPGAFRRRYFALVMATGIVSIASERAGFHMIAVTLLWLNTAQFLVLWILTSWRLLRYRRAFYYRLDGSSVGAGISLGSGCHGRDGKSVLLAGAFNLALGLWFFGIFLWITLTYTIFAKLTIMETKPTIDQGITGAWLLAVVSTQAISLLSALLARHISQPLRLDLNFLALSMLLWGGMMYISIISLIFYRYMFFKFSPADFVPSYWINMGAMAISTLAGSVLIENAADAWFLDELLPFLKGFTIFFWAAGTWWIPLLIILVFWRHIYRRFPLRYDPAYWSAVFPLGMYTICTYEMASAMRLEFLRPIADVFIYAALLAWTATFIGLVRNLVGKLIPALKPRY